MDPTTVTATDTHKTLVPELMVQRSNLDGTYCTAANGYFQIYLIKRRTNINTIARGLREYSDNSS